jgi:hypothetical protein
MNWLQGKVKYLTQPRRLRRVLACHRGGEGAVTRTTECS